MTCDDARMDLESLDQPTGAIEEHITECASCQIYITDLRSAFDELRAVPPPPDLLGPAVTKVRRTGQGRRLMPLVSMAAGLTLGAIATLGWIAATSQEADPSPVVVASINERMADLLPRSDRYAAVVEVIERNWHPAVPERTYGGTLVVEAPERFDLNLTDITDYPSPDWLPNDLWVVIDEDQAQIVARSGCTPQLLPGCSRVADVLHVSHRAPFDQTTNVGYELAVPIGTWAASRSASDPVGPPPIPTAIGIEVSAVQASGLLDAFFTHGDWRQLYPADRVSVWIDPETLAPIEISVRALDSAARQAWAASLGYSDSSDQSYLEIRFTSDSSIEFLPLATGASTESGFTESEPAISNLLGFAPHRSGGVGDDRLVTTWSRGFAWIRVDEFSEWDGSRFPGSPTAVVPVNSEGFDTGFLDVATNRLFLHTPDTQYVISTNTGHPMALAAAEALGLSGLPVPESWAEAATLSLTNVDLFGLLVPPGVIRDFVGVAEVDGGTRLAGLTEGAEFFELIQRRGDRMPLPSGATATGVLVRGTNTRYLPELHRLEWLERGSIVTLTIPGADLTRLAQFAEALEMT